MTSRLPKALLLSVATLAPLLAGVVTAVPAAADEIPGIDGMLTVTNATGPFTVSVIAEEVNGNTADGFTGVATVESDGTFTIVGLEPASYNVCVIANVVSNLMPNCHPVAVVFDGENTTTGADITTTQGGGITGMLRVGSGTGSPNPEVEARVYKDNGSGYYEYVARSATVGIDGIYRFPSLEPGTYAVELASLNIAYSSEFWNDSRYFAGRTDVEVTVGSTVDLGLSVLSPRTLDVDRLYGANRFATSVDISQRTFDSAAAAAGVPVVYIANGLNYPDALSAGPAAAHQGGGLLLVLPTAIPTEVAAELDRLNPEKIVVVGSTDSVSSSVKTALQAYVDSPSDVVRIGGANRYETSRMLVLDAFDEGSASDIFIATGVNYPDALSAGPAAAYRGAPLLLVNGAGSSLDTETRAVLNYLNTENALIAGGFPSVSDGVGTSLASFLGGSSHVERYAGANRYETSVLISIGTFAQSEYALLATGSGFADALAGGTLAASLGAPIYLSQQSCVPNEVLTDIIFLQANGVYLLGGEPSLGPAVEQLQSCSVPTSLSSAGGRDLQLR